MTNPVVIMNPVTQGEVEIPDWQYGYTCAAGEWKSPEGKKELVVVFGSRTLQDGSKVALVSSWPTEVPLEQVSLFDRRMEGGWRLDGTRKRAQA